MIPLLTHILPHTSQQLPIVHAYALQQRDEVVRGVRAVWATVVLATRRKCLSEQFLTGVRRVAAAALVGVAAHIAVDVADVVEVFGLELFCRK